ncbi:alpha/beta fold hydrolase [uncultured Martelella sp.]|uniref:alpha/beta hydrolase n=1 Tax=uncultured Martelella sp. TaxID=392331 RepID=UPI0029C88465|nr:alpha/beta fold hydrolase [uncultured Martelella sp.]
MPVTTHILENGMNRFGKRLDALHIILSVLAVLLLSACTSRPDTVTIYPRPEAAGIEGARTVTVYVATTRERAAQPIDGFTREREFDLSYAEFVISIPPDHAPGEIEWPYSPKANPEDYFTVLKHTMLSQSAFDARIARRARETSQGSVGIFVHGFNVSFQEGLFRMAQLAADSNVPGVPVLFSWPSQARILDYATDKESATFSRDGLADVIEQVTAQSSVRSVMLFGHSMGGWLTMEALRQLSLEGKQTALRKLNVILAAPDIDEDVFAAQVDVIGPLDPPLMVMVSSDDRALGFSRLIQGNRQRTGQLDITDPEVLEQAQAMNVSLLDISSISSRDMLNHSRYAALAAIYPELDEDADLGSDLRTAGVRFLDTMGRIIDPANILGQAMDAQEAGR